MKPHRTTALRRGASLTEYALLLVGVLVLGAGAMKLLGGALSNRSASAGSVVTSGAGSGGGQSSGGGGGGGGAGGGGHAASKASLGGGASTDEVSGGSGKTSRGTDNEHPASNDGVMASIADGDMDSPRIKRIMAICFLGAGAGALGYYAYRARKALNKKPDVTT
jgi:Flp pilus assembly pilin Flp